MFKPERFLGNYYPRDAFLPFSGGPHGCIGRGYVFLCRDSCVHVLTWHCRFAETEAVAVLTAFVSKYRVGVCASRARHSCSARRGS